MPRSVVIYTSSAAFSGLAALLRLRAETRAFLPYTLSFAQKTGAGTIRVRVTELLDEAVLPAIMDMVKRGEASLASEADRDVRSASYEELITGADRTGRIVRLQWTSPLCVSLEGVPVPFPVMPLVFAGYRAKWSAFSPVPLPQGAEDVEMRARMVDFRISCVTGPPGPGAQGWAVVELEKGRTEEEIALFNGLVDFAFYCGTGLYTGEGWGQTRRMDRLPQARTGFST